MLDTNKHGCPIGLTGKDNIMMKAVKWFHMEEEFCIGLVLMNDDKPVFITKEAERFEAPLLTICDTLTEAVGRKWFFGDDGFEDMEEEDQQAYLKEVADISAEYREARSQILLRRFLRQMDELFSQYAKDGCLDGYKLEGHCMYVSSDGEHCDHSYLWPALDGALHLYNKTHDCAIWLEEYAPENGIIKYEFGYDIQED